MFFSLSLSHILYDLLGRLFCRRIQVRTWFYANLCQFIYFAACGSCWQNEEMCRIFPASVICQTVKGVRIYAKKISHCVCLSVHKYSYYLVFCLRLTQNTKHSRWINAVNISSSWPILPNDNSFNNRAGGWAIICCMVMQLTETLNNIMLISDMQMSYLELFIVNPRGGENQYKALKNEAATCETS